MIQQPKVPIEIEALNKTQTSQTQTPQPTPGNTQEAPSTIARERAGNGDDSYRKFTPLNINDANNTYERTPGEQNSKRSAIEVEDNHMMQPSLNANSVYRPENTEISELSTIRQGMFKHSNDDVAQSLRKSSKEAKRRESKMINAKQGLSTIFSIAANESILTKDQKVDIQLFQNNVSGPASSMMSMKDKLKDIKPEKISGRGYLTFDKRNEDRSSRYRSHAVSKDNLNRHEDGEKILSPQMRNNSFMVKGQSFPMDLGTEKVGQKTITGSNAFLPHIGVQIPSILNDNLNDNDPTSIASPLSGRFSKLQSNRIFRNGNSKSRLQRYKIPTNIDQNQQNEMKDAVQQYYEGFKVQALPILTNRRNSSNPVNMNTQTMPADTFGDLYHIIATRVEDSGQKKKTSIKFQLFGKDEQDSENVDPVQTMRRFKKHTSHLVKPRRDYRTVSPGVKFAHRLRHESKSRSSKESYRASPKEIAQMVAKGLPTDQSTLPVNLLPQYRLKIHGKAVEAKPIRVNNKKRIFDRNMRFGKNMIMTSEGSQANLATPTPALNAGILLPQTKMDPSAEVTGQDITSSFTPHEGRNTPSRDLMNHLGLKMKTPSPRIDVDMKSPDLQTIMSVNQIHQEMSQENNKSPKSHSKSELASKQINQLQSHSRKYLDLENSKSRNSASTKRDKQQKLEQMSAIGSKINYQQKNALPNDLGGQNLQFGQVVTPFGPTSNLLVQQNQPDLTATVNSQQKVSTLHGDGFEAEGNDMNPIDQMINSLSGSREKSHSSQARKMRHVVKKANTSDPSQAFLAIKNDSTTGIVQPISPDNQATIFKLLRKHGAVERPIFKPQQSQQPTQSDSVTKFLAQPTGSDEKLLNNQDNNHYNIVSNSSLHDMVNQPSKYLNEEVTGDQVNLQSGPSPQSTKLQSFSQPAVAQIMSSPLASGSFDEFQHSRSIEPGSLPLSPTYGTKNNFSRPLFGGHKGSSQIQNIHTRNENVTAFRVNQHSLPLSPQILHQRGSPNSSSFMQQLQQFNQKMDFVEFKRGRNDDKVLKGVGALLQMKSELLIRGEMQTINQGLTADSLRLKLKNKNKVIMKDGGAGQSNPDLAENEDNTLNQDISKQIEDIEEAKNETKSAKNKEAAQRIGNKTELQKFGPRKSDDVKIQLIDESHPQINIAQPLNQSPSSPIDGSSYIISSNIRGSPLHFGFDPSATITLSAQKMQKNSIESLKSTQLAPEGSKKDHSPPSGRGDTTNLMQTSDRQLLLSPRPSMDTIFPKSNIQSNSAFNVIEQIKERPSETYATHEVNKESEMLKERMQILETPHMMEVVADSISEEVSMSSAPQQEWKCDTTPQQISLNQRLSTSVKESNEPMDEHTQQHGQKLIQQLIARENSIQEVVHGNVDPFKQAVGTSYFALSPLSPSFQQSQQNDNGKSKFHSNKMSRENLKLFKQLCPDGSAQHSSNSPSYHLINDGQRTFYNPQKSHARSHVQSKENLKKLQRHVHIERNRYGSKQSLGGKILQTLEVIDTRLGPEEINKLERSAPFATIVDHSGVDSSRRRMAIYKQFEDQMSTERRKLQYAIDILPKQAKLHPAQPRAPQNRYFKKGQRRSVPVINYPMILSQQQSNKPVMQQHIVEALETQLAHENSMQQVNNRNISPNPGTAEVTQVAQSAKKSSQHGAGDDLDFINDFMYAKEFPQDRRSPSNSGNYQSDSNTPPLHGMSHISLQQQSSIEAIATSLRRIHMQSQIGPSEKQLPVVANMNSDHQRKLMTDKFRAFSKQNHHVDGSGSRRRHQLEINELSRPEMKNTSFRATQGFDLRNINQSSQHGSMTNLKSLANNIDAQPDQSRSKYGTPTKTQYQEAISTKMRDGENEMSYHQSTTRIDLEKARRGSRFVNNSSQMEEKLSEEDDELKDSNNSSMKFDSRLPKRKASHESTINVSGAFQLIKPYPQQQQHSPPPPQIRSQQAIQQLQSRQLLSQYLQPQQQMGNVLISGTGLLQSTEMILDSSFLNSKNLKSVLKTTGKRSDSYTGFLFDPVRFERYKVLQNGADSVYSNEGPKAREMIARLNQQGRAEVFGRSEVAKEVREQQDFLRKVEDFKKELGGGTASYSRYTGQTSQQL